MKPRRNEGSATQRAASMDGLNYYPAMFDYAAAMFTDATTLREVVVQSNWSI